MFVFKLADRIIIEQLFNALEPQPIGFMLHYPFIEFSLVYDYNVG
jgi:hypothetical protein